MARTKTIEERFWAKVDKGDGSGCWLWTAATNGVYGRIMISGRLVSAHRLSWEMHNGRPVPDGLQVDHLCSVPLCVRPDHLDAVTPRVNVLRSSSPESTRRRYKGLCRRGHRMKWNPAHTQRVCNKCIQIRRRNGKKCGCGKGIDRRSEQCRSCASRDREAVLARARG